MIRKMMKVAIEGCCHGALDQIYSHIATLERAGEFKVDLLLICGDFQAIRNHSDLKCMAVPQKYRELGGFHKYYLGQKKAPILTIVIGGNHEASNYLWELYHGGWLAPNIYFLGFSGCVRVNGVRIAGASGIYKGHDYRSGYHESVPYDNSSIRSIYHTRQYDVFKLSQLSPPDIFLSHDWPNTIERYGDTDSLLRRKPYFRQEHLSATLGSPPMLELLKTIKPSWWFSAHLHTKFEAVYNHTNPNSSTPAAGPRAENPDEILIDDDFDDAHAGPVIENPDEIKIDEEEEDVDAENAKRPVAAKIQTAEREETRFLALDKCLPRRDFLEIVDIPVSDEFATPSEGGSPRFTFDPEWLAISRALHPYLSTTKVQAALPKPDEARAMIASELEWVRTNVGNGGLREINDVQKFWRTAPGPGQEEPAGPVWYTNPQTEAFARLLQVSSKGAGAETEGGSLHGSGAAEISMEDAAGFAPVPTGDENDTLENVDGGGEETHAAESGGWSPSRVAE
ncbi:lariat debranching enzyme, C-terminal domain-containing protein [Hysterangium stoloniferum]|nr:lariat debranching enzyme, C-terminal domain-containing protein [Hysterangium stoloniferum]